MSTTPDLSHAFADFVAGCRYEHLPPAAIDGAKKSILDTLGVMLAASGTEPAIGRIVKLVQEQGGPPESTVLGCGMKAPAMWAGFANGSMAHCLDFDDHAPEGHHPSSSIAPAALALAERAGGLSGQDLITAVAVGQDLFMRLRRNVESRIDWHLTTVLGVFSAAATAAHVLKLNREQAIDTFGIAAMSCAGTMELAYGVGSGLRGLYAGFSTKGALLAALMAAKGVAGMKTVFEGKAGILPVYFHGHYEREQMLEGLGRTFAGGDILFKPWPCCGVSHGPIHATMELMKAHRLSIADIEQIRVHVGDFGYRLCQPLEDRRRPATSADAKFSIPFCVAVAATYGEVRVGHFYGEGLRDARVLEAARKIEPFLDAGDNWKMALPKGRVEIRTKDGRTLARGGDDVPGDPETPMSWDYIDAKFADCASLAARAPTPEKIHEAQGLARRLETIADATDLMRALA